jgi:hypothetical protein
MEQKPEAPETKTTTTNEVNSTTESESKTNSDQATLTPAAQEDTAPVTE